MVPAAADERTRQYLRDLMQRIPTDLVDQVRMLRDEVDRIVQRARKLQDDVGGVQFGMDRLCELVRGVESITHELCNTATEAGAIGPLWELLNGEGSVEEAEEETDDPD